MNHKYYEHIDNQIQEITENKLFKHERIIVNPQNPRVILKDGKELLNFCANNYLGLADDADVIASSKKALDKYGYGMASVRFICGTNQIHKDLEAAISKFLGFEDTILFSSCFDANGGVFETMLGAEDAIISDELNHASIIDGVRLCKAKRFRYKNNNMQDLEEQLKAADAAGARFKMIATDGVFSMDGIIADLKSICDLADKYNALVLVDDSHATGFTGKNGRGTPEYCGVEGRIDVMTGTLGKALGGASGGYISAKKSVIDLLRNRARPYLFSNSLAPVITAATITVLEKVVAANELREQLERNKKQFRDGMAKAGFDLVPGEHAIIPVMLYDEKLAVEFAQKLLDHGIYVIPFSFPVVPKGKARIRTQMSAKHSPEQIDKAIAAFTAVGKELNIIK
ncbi:glycine C-acetyltransferase [Aquella oligotrophica]|uniref:2-amino-3-ketobutyrate coenzyme A ligase n=1 Tax=Aquella oligotrophica TaxID=2067065 RepID=A0A2I7N3G3_9NEIS|nr:glycine C-acetyltransferase [Aquella oligotrophica]AUR50997.1 glycine C-acetyltransferase [Aquella oligotrophica]